MYRSPCSDCAKTSSFLLAITVGVLVALSGWLVTLGYLPLLLMQVAIGGILVFALSEWLKLEAYLYTKNILKEKLIAIYHARK